MRRVIKKYFVSHEGNEHKPYLLREQGVLVLGAVILILFVFAQLQAYMIRTHAPAAVINSVIVDLANRDRANRGVKPLVMNPVLVQAAQLKANDMVARGYFGHVSPDNVTPWHWFSIVNYNFIYAGENLAVNFSESSDVEKAWMQSSGHRDNILNTKFTEIGVATAEGMFNGKPTVFVVQLFGRPMSTTTLAQISAQRKPVYTSTLTNASSTIISKPNEQQVQITAVKDMFLAVEDASVSKLESKPSPSTAAPQHYSNAISRLIFEPKRVLVIAYGVIGCLILVVFSFILIGEIKKHHAKMVLYGLGLIMVMLVLAYVYGAYIVHTVQIV